MSTDETMVPDPIDPEMAHIDARNPEISEDETEQESSDEQNGAVTEVEPDEKEPE
jgi:hypothetical protein